MIQGLMMIAPRAKTPLLDFLQTKFAGDPEVVVISDRRVGPRRKHQMSPLDERRATDRRVRAGGLIVYMAPM